MENQKAIIKIGYNQLKKNGYSIGQFTTQIVDSLGKPTGIITNINFNSGWGTGWGEKEFTIEDKCIEYIENHVAPFMLKEKINQYDIEDNISTIDWSFDYINVPLKPISHKTKDRIRETLESLLKK